MTSSDVAVTAVESKADFERFLRVPWRIYREDPQWVPPLLMERRDHLNPKKNPFFDFAEVAYWLAWRGGEVIGQVAVRMGLVNEFHDMAKMSLPGIWRLRKETLGIGANEPVRFVGIRVTEINRKGRRLR